MHDNPYASLIDIANRIDGNLAVLGRATMVALLALWTRTPPPNG